MCSKPARTQSPEPLAAIVNNHILIQMNKYLKDLENAFKDVDIEIINGTQLIHKTKIIFNKQKIIFQVKLLLI